MRGRERDLFLTSLAFYKIQKKKKTKIINKNASFLKIWITKPEGNAGEICFSRKNGEFFIFFWVKEKNLERESVTELKRERRRRRVGR